MITDLDYNKVLFQLMVVPTFQNVPFGREDFDLHVTSGNFDAKLGSSLLVFSSTTGHRYLLLGLGSVEEFKPSHSAKIVKSIYSAVKGIEVIKNVAFGLEDVINYLHERDAFMVELGKQCVSQSYKYDATKTEQEPSVANITPLTVDALIDKFSSGQAIGTAMNTVKHLGDLPSNICTPTYLAEYAAGLPVDVEILDAKKMTKLGMNALMSVAKGSDVEPKTIIMKYNGGESQQKPIVLIGKGVTFDSGGINIKSHEVEEMKYDMLGGATVIGVIEAISALELPINVVGIVGAVENMPSGKSSKPSDIITSMSGITVEIKDTDAEGRLVLCDLLEYAKRFDPEQVVDIATLTGAVLSALGFHATGLFSNDSELTKELLDAGVKSHDRCWELPMWEEYDKQIDSDFADVCNLGKDYAGSITAACFLGRFAKDFKWAHLDIAGSSLKGAPTGRPVPMLVEFLMNKVGK